MIGRCAILTYSLPVLLRRIALVRLPVVLRIFLVEFVHIVVTECLCEYRRGGDGQILAVAFDDGGVGQGAVGLEPVSVDDDGLRSHGELVEGPVHGEDGGVEDVYPVYLLWGDDAHSPGGGIALDDLAEGLAPPCRQLLGVVEIGVVVVVGEDDGGGKDAAGKTAPAGLVAAGLEGVVVIIMA